MKLYRSQSVRRLCTRCSEQTEVECTICSAPVCAQHRIENHWCTNCALEYHENKRPWLSHTLSLAWFMIRKRGTGRED